MMEKCYFPAIKLYEDLRETSFDTFYRAFYHVQLQFNNLQLNFFPHGQENLCLCIKCSLTDKT